MAACPFRPPFLRHQKENAPRPVEKKKCFGGSVRASADLLPPAREGWLSLAAVRDGNAFPLGSFKPGEVPDTLCADFTRKGYAASVSGKAANGCAAAAAGLPLRDKGRHIGRPLYVGGLLPSIGADLRVRPLERPFAGP